MHKSKLAGFIVDCQVDDVEKAAAFWGAALGMDRRRPADPAEQAYIELLDRQHGIHIEVQRVTHPSRVHLDIETDDLDAEVARLEGLGARRIEFVRRWWVMEAPTGQRFCVVDRCTPDFDQKATTWD